jgi:hypothetical protein
MRLTDQGIPSTAADRLLAHADAARLEDDRLVPERVGGCARHGGTARTPRAAREMPCPRHDAMPTTHFLPST